MNDKAIIGGVIVLLLAVGVVLFATGGSTPPVAQTVPSESPSTPTNTAPASGPNLPLAQCLKDKGAVFYGAFWCPHCKAQEALFEAAAPALPYVECATADGNAQTFVCQEKKITGYPTWKFADGSELTGEQSFQTLAEKTGCTAALPGATASSSARR